MPGLTAKVFRTYNASFTMSELLKELHNDPRSKGTVAEKVKLYNDCNRKVAILCNHKRTVGAGHDQQMQKLGDRVRQGKPVPESTGWLTKSTDQGTAIPKVADKEDDPGH